MTGIERLREQLDACRPGSDDLSLPALTELAQAAERDRAVSVELTRSQQFDQAVAAAMHDVEIPAGLLDRLLTATSNPDASAELSLPARATELEQKSIRATSRRAWLVAGSSTALLLLVALGGSAYWLWPTRVVGQDELSVAAIGWLDAVDNEGWTASGVAGFPGDPALRVKPQRQQKIPAADLRWSARITAYDLSSAGEPQAILFVVRSAARYDVPQVPTPSSPLRGLSQGWEATAWQRAGSSYLFVLVIREGHNQRLNNYVQPPRFS